MKIRPMLAAKTPDSLESLRYPVYASPKIDGIRCLILSAADYEAQTNKKSPRDYIAVSRTLKPIPNLHIQHCLDDPAFLGFDGELAVGPPNSPNLMQETMSGCTTRSGAPDFTYWVFDNWTRCKTPFSRIAAYYQTITPPSQVRFLPQVLVHDAEELAAYEQEMLADGYEGVIVRCPNSPYKFNRSTQREQYLTKIKRFATSEAEIVGFTPWYHNANDAELDERGYIKRSTHQANKVAAEMLGSFKVRENNMLFGVGGGMTIEQRIHFWRIRESLLGQHLTYKHFAASGVKDNPRHTIFVSLRHEIDL